MDPENLEDILKLKTKRGATQTKSLSTFTGYVGDVSTIGEVNRLYVKLKLIQPEARHIVCAYWIKHPERCYSADFHDDGEPAAGRLLLDELTSNNLQGKAIFVARKFIGVKMGVDRLICYTNAARLALGIPLDQINQANWQYNSGQIPNPSFTIPKQHMDEQQLQTKPLPQRQYGTTGRRNRYQQQLVRGAKTSTQNEYQRKEQTTVNSNTVNPKFHLNQSFFISLLFHV